MRGETGVFAVCAVRGEAGVFAVAVEGAVNAFGAASCAPAVVSRSPATADAAMLCSVGAAGPCPAYAYAALAITLNPSAPVATQAVVVCCILFMIPSSPLTCPLPNQLVVSSPGDDNEKRLIRAHTSSRANAGISINRTD